MKSITAFVLCVFLIYSNPSMSQENKPSQWVLLVYASLKSHLVEKGFENEVIAENKSRVKELEEPEIIEVNNPSLYLYFAGMCSMETCSVDINNLKIEWASTDTQRIKSSLPFRTRKLDSKSELYKLREFPRCIVASKSFFEKLESELRNHPNTPTLEKILPANNHVISLELDRD